MGMKYLSAKDYLQNHKVLSKYSIIGVQEILKWDLKKSGKILNGFKGYQISNTGIIKSLKSNKILKQRKDKDGYLIINLSNGSYRNTIRVHKLVAKTFLDNPNNFPCINHKDENKENNNVENLEWCSFAYNLNYNNLRFRNGIKHSKSVIQFDTHKNKIQEFCSIKDAKKKTGINNIIACCKGKQKTAGGYIWEYVV